MPRSFCGGICGTCRCPANTACATSAGCIPRPRNGGCASRRSYKSRSSSWPRRRPRPGGTRTARASRSCASARCPGRRGRRRVARYRHDQRGPTILAGRAATRGARRGRERCHSARKTAPTLAGATPTRCRRQSNDRSSPPGAPPARFIRVGLSARRNPASNTKRISLLGLLCLRLSPGLFNPRPDSRYGESERSELGSETIESSLNAVRFDGRLRPVKPRGTGQIKFQRCPGSRGKSLWHKPSVVRPTWHGRQHRHRQKCEPIFDGF
jgi:hypothetical protein